MTITDEQLLAMEGVGFFGEISASISHEFKNVLAILNENTGLLDDLARMIERGVPVSPERLVRLSQSLSRNIERADGIVKNMNRFSHSADQPSEVVDLQEAVAFVARLGARIFDMKGARFELETTGSPVKVRTNRFFLENLVWRCMLKAMDALNLDGAIHIFVDVSEEGPRIRFAGSPGGEKASEANLTPREEVLLQMLGARAALNLKNGEISVFFGST
jgi:C4-dicarboxylate-specific signal transduction histidine kinase